MKIAMVFFVVFHLGCSIKMPNDSAGNAFQESAEKGSTLVRIREWLRDHVESFSAIFDNNPPASNCDAVVEHSPTLKEFQESWREDKNAVFCPEWGPQKETCFKKRQEAFSAGLSCYSK